MLLTTTDGVEGAAVSRYLGIVSGEAATGGNVFRDVLAGLGDFTGGRSNAYERTVREAKELALADLAKAAEALDADAVIGVDLDYAVIGVDLDYQVIGIRGAMLMVSANGTAVKLTASP